MTTEWRLEILSRAARKDPRAEYVPIKVCVAKYLVTCGNCAWATNRAAANYSGVVFKNLFGQWWQQAGSSAYSGRVRYVTVRKRPTGPTGSEGRGVPWWCNVLERA